MQNIEAHPTKRPIFKRSAETERLIELLATAQVGDTITWSTMQAALNGQTIERVRAAASAARRYLLNEQQIIFGAVFGIGIKRLNNAEVTACEGTTPTRVRRIVGRSMKRLATVNPDTLAPGDAAKYRTTSAVLGAVSLCVKPSAMLKVKQITHDSTASAVQAAQALLGK